MKFIDNSLTIMPTLTYRSGSTAIEWLCRAFGLKPQLMVLDDNSAIAHAQLVYVNGMILLAATTNEFYKLVTSLAEAVDPKSHSSYVFVQDMDAHYAQAIGAGAEIVTDIHDDDRGGRSYSCRDLEGHIWNFGSYNPWRY